MPVAGKGPSGDWWGKGAGESRRRERAEEALRAARAALLGAALGMLLVLASRRARR